VLELFEELPEVENSDALNGEFLVWEGREHAARLRAYFSARGITNALVEERTENGVTYTYVTKVQK
jgi:hypothetical protein